MEHEAEVRALRAFCLSNRHVRINAFRYGPAVGWTGVLHLTPPINERRTMAHDTITRLQAAGWHLVEFEYKQFGAAILTVAIPANVLGAIDATNVPEQCSEPTDVVLGQINES